MTLSSSEGKLRERLESEIRKSQKLLEENAQLKVEVEILRKKAASAPKAASSAPSSSAPHSAPKSDPDARLVAELEGLRRDLQEEKSARSGEVRAVLLEAAEQAERARLFVSSFESKLQAKEQTIAELRRQLADTKAKTPMASLPTAQPEPNHEEAAVLSKIRECLDSFYGDGRKSTSRASTSAPKRLRDDDDSISLRSYATTEMGTSRTRGAAAADTPVTPAASVADPATAGQQRKKRVPKVEPGKTLPAAAAAVAAMRATHVPPPLPQVARPPAPSVTSAHAPAFGPDAVRDYIRQRGASGPHEVQLAKQFLAHCQGPATAAERFVDHITSLAATETRTATRTALRTVLAAMRPLGIEADFLRAAWRRSLQVMRPDSCHVDHSSQLYAIGLAISKTLDATTNEADGPHRGFRSVCLIDVLCAMLHARNHESEHAEQSCALRQTLSFFEGLLERSATTALDVVEAAVFHVLSEVCQDPGTAPGDAALLQRLCEAAHWHLTPTMSCQQLFEALVAGLKLAATVPEGTRDDQWSRQRSTRMHAARVLLLHLGFTALPTALDALTDATDEAAEVLAFACLDFGLTAASDGWPRIAERLRAFIGGPVPTGPLTEAQLVACHALLRACTSASAADRAESDAQLAADFLRAHEHLGGRAPSAIVASDLTQILLTSLRPAQ